MPEKQVKLIHVFMHKHIKQLVLQTSHNGISIHNKCRRLHREKNRWGSWVKPKSCVRRHDESEKKKCTVGSYHIFFIPSFPYFYLCPPCFVQVWNPHKTAGDWRLLSRVHSGGAGVMHWAHPKLSRPTNSSSPRRRQLRYHYACHCKWTTSSVCVCVIRPLTFIWPDLSFSWLPLSFSLSLHPHFLSL